MSNILESNADLNEKVVEIINMLKQKRDSQNNTMNLFSIRQIKKKPEPIDVSSIIKKHVIPPPFKKQVNKPVVNPVVVNPVVDKPVVDNKSLFLNAVKRKLLEITQIEDIKTQIRNVITQIGGNNLISEIMNVMTEINKLNDNNYLQQILIFFNSVLTLGQRFNFDLQNKPELLKFFGETLFKPVEEFFKKINTLQQPGPQVPGPYVPPQVSVPQVPGPYVPPQVSVPQVLAPHVVPGPYVPPQVGNQMVSQSPYFVQQPNPCLGFNPYYTPSPQPQQQELQMLIQLQQQELQMLIQLQQQQNNLLQSHLIQQEDNNSLIGNLQQQIDYLQQQMEQQDLQLQEENNNLLDNNSLILALQQQIDEMQQQQQIVQQPQQNGNLQTQIGNLQTQISDLQKQLKDCCDNLKSSPSGKSLDDFKQIIKNRLMHVLFKQLIKNKLGKIIGSPTGPPPTVSPTVVSPPTNTTPIPLGSTKPVSSVK
jgi:hypothetical protein